MTDHDPHDPRDLRLGDRMDHAVGGLRAPDVLAEAVRHGRRRRTHRRLVLGAGGLAAVTAVALAVPSVAGGRSDPTAGTRASDPAASGSASSPPGAGQDEDPCGPEATGWWSRSSDQIRSDLADLLPAGVGVGSTDDRWYGTWGGDLVTGDDEDFASLTLLPPPGTPGTGGLVTLEDAQEGPCAAGDHDPLQAVQPCDRIDGTTSCQEIRSADGRLVGVVTEKVEQAVVDGQDQPTDRAYLIATVVGPGGGHVELYVGEGLRTDRPSTAHDPADVPALTPEQAIAIVDDDGWTQ